MENEFRLTADETMRRLRVIATSNSELEWRFELLAMLDRMRIQQEVTNSGILVSLGQMRRSVAHVTPVKLAELVDAKIEETMKPRDRDANRLWAAGMWILEKSATVGIAVFCTFIGLKAHHG